MPPKISVLLPIYRGEPYLRQTLDALLGQTFGDFEIVVVNDASPDASRQVIATYTDRRIRLLDNPVNLGQTGSLQLALEQAQGEYLARQDQDDICLPERFAQQVAFLDCHPEVGVLGTNYGVIDQHGRLLMDTVVDYPPETLAEMAWRLLWTDRLVDSSVMFRRTAAAQVGGYDLRHRYAQDYDLWVRLSFVTGVARLPNTLLHLRIHNASASSRYAEAQDLEVVAIIQSALSRVLSEPVSAAAAAVLHRTINGADPVPSEQVSQAIAVILASVRPFIQARRLTGQEHESVKRAVAETLVKLAVRHRTSLGWAAPQLLLKAWAYYPSLLVRPRVWVSWLGQRRQAQRYRRMVSSLWAG